MDNTPQPFQTISWVRRDNALFEKVDRFMTPKTYIDGQGKLVSPAYHEGRVQDAHVADPLLQVRGKVPDKIDSPYMSFAELQPKEVSPASYGRDAIVLHGKIALTHPELVEKLRTSPHPEAQNTATYTKTGANWLITDTDNAKYKSFAEQYGFSTTGPLTEVQRAMIYSTHDKEALHYKTETAFDVYMQTAKTGQDPRFGEGTYVKLTPNELLVRQREWESRGAMRPANDKIPEMLEKYGRKQPDVESVKHSDVQEALKHPALDKDDKSALERESKLMQMRKDGISLEKMPENRDVNRPGRVADVDDKSVYLDVGRKHQIEVPLTALQGATLPKVGDDVRLVAKDGKATLAPVVHQQGRDMSLVH